MKFSTSGHNKGNVRYPLCVRRSGRLIDPLNVPYGRGFPPSKPSPLKPKGAYSKNSFDREHDVLEDRSRRPDVLRDPDGCREIHR